MVPRTLWMLGLAFLIPLPRGPSRPAAQRAEPIAVITNPESMIENLTMEQLRRFYLGRTTVWPAGRPVVLFESPAVRDGFYRSVLGLSPQIVRQRWIAISFRGEPGTPPREVDDLAELLRLVRVTPGALGFVPVSAVTASVRVLRIDGRLPADPNYPIQATP